MKLYRNRLDFYQLLFKAKTQNVNPKLNWYENLFATFVGGLGKLLAKILKIKGNTLVWNQLAENGNFADTSGWIIAGTPNGASVSVLNNEATFQFATNSISSLYRPISYVNGHKYYYAISIKGDATYTNLISATLGASYYIMTYDSITTSYKRFERVLTINSTSTNLNVVRNNSSNNEKAYIKDCILVDLTALGLDYITDPSEFTSLYPLPYYDYSSGSLLSFNGTGIKSVGFNQWDEEWEDGDINATTGENAGGSSRWRSKNYIHILPNETYYIYADVESTTIQIRARFYDANKNYLGYYDGSSQEPKINKTFLTPSNAHYMRFSPNDSQIAEGTKMCFNISSSENGTYKPYKSNTLSLPISTYFPTGMKSAGSVYDELTPTKAITRVGTRIMATEFSWSYSSTGSYMYAAFGASKLYAFTEVPNFTVSNNLKVVKYNDRSASADPLICVDGNKTLQVRNTGYTDVDAFKTYLGNAEINFELNTPTEVSIDPPLDLSYEIEWGGTEQLLPENTSTPTTSPILADIKYPDGERDDQYFTYREITQTNVLLGKSLNMIMGREVEFNKDALDILMKGE